MEVTKEECKASDEMLETIQLEKWNKNLEETGHKFQEELEAQGKLD